MPTLAGQEKIYNNLQMNTRMKKKERRMKKKHNKQIPIHYTQNRGQIRKMSPQLKYACLQK